MQNTTASTQNITADMQRLLDSMNPATREKITVLDTTYKCECGGSKFNDALIKLAGETQKMPRISECEKCKALKENETYQREKTLDKWAFCKVEQMRAQKRGFYIHGSFGTGKTHTAKRLHVAAARQGLSAKFTTPQAILQAFNDCFSSDMRESQVLAELAHFEILIIDDIGQEQVTERGLSQLWQVINARYERKRPTVYTSNYALSELTARYAEVNRTQAESICSRIAGACEQQEMTGVDRRLTA
jgi:DNA replication protein DnaC